MSHSPIPYVLGPRIGMGTYAEVFHATSRGDGSVVAFKRAKEGDPAAVKRLRREVKVQGLLDHPNVMPVLDFDLDRAWFTMPLADGSLKELWETGRLGTDSEALALDLVDQLSHGLEHAHEAGYLHRDISPGNILGFRQENGRWQWVVGDWGMVRRPIGQTTTPLTAPGEGLGTAGFAAPETYEVDAHEVDERADVYSLGRLIAWLLTGRWPRPNIPLRPVGRLRGFVDECTDVEASRRPGSMTELRGRLGELTSEAPTSPRGKVQLLVESMATDPSSVARALVIGFENDDSDEIWVDEIARMPLDAVRTMTAQDPELAVRAARNMLRLSGFDRWGHRDYNDANMPLRWVHEVVRVLVEEDELGLAEDLASDDFVSEMAWDRWPQKRVTVAWLRSLNEAEGVIIARAIRRSRTRDYYQPEMANGRILSHTLAAELGR
jgi:serine/threonine protein kinase